MNDPRVQWVINNDSICWTVDRSVKGQSKIVMRDVTAALVNSGPVLCLPALRMVTIDEWYFRIRFLQRLQIGWWFDSNTGATVYPSYDDICDHVGLRTHGPRSPRKTWMRTAMMMVAVQVEYSIKHDLHQRQRGFEK